MLALVSPGDSRGDDATPGHQEGVLAITGSAEPVAVSELREKLVTIARYRYALQTTDALDAFQDAVVTWMEIRDRYSREKEPLKVFLGVFHKKCLELIDRQSRERKKLKQPGKLPEAPNGRRLGSALCGSEPSTLSTILQREEGRQILQALAGLDPEAREVFRLLAEEDVPRHELIAMLNLNANTVDTRLRKFRRELRNVLKKLGVYI